MRVLVRVVVLGALLYAATAGFVALLAWRAATDTRAQADAILVLGAGPGGPGALNPIAIRRVEKGVALWRAGAAPRIVFSNGPGSRGAAPGGLGMAALAVSLGVPEEAVTAEVEAHSTLQNMLFTRPLVGDGPVILVTEGFHLPRARASAAAFGIEVAAGVASERFRPRHAARLVLREAAAVWFNAARWALWKVAGALGVPREVRDPWIA